MINMPGTITHGYGQMIAAAHVAKITAQQCTISQVDRHGDSRRRCGDFVAREEVGGFFERGHGVHCSSPRRGVRNGEPRPK